MVNEILFIGRENAISGRQLCKALGISQRELQAQVEKERRAGCAICSACGTNPGYFLARHRGEMNEFCWGMFKRAGEIHKTRRACLQTLAKLPPAPGEEETADLGPVSFGEPAPAI